MKKRNFSADSYKPKTQTLGDVIDLLIKVNKYSTHEAKKLLKSTKIDNKKFEVEI